MTIQKVGIALAAYQPPADFFFEQLHSIQQQTFENWVCVVCSDSDLQEFLSSDRFSRFTDDRRFIWRVNEERLGHKKNFESAIQATLDLGVDAIACCDQDDVWYSQKLARLVSELNRAGPLSLVHSDMHLLWSDRCSLQTGWQLEHRGVQNAKTHHLLIRNVVAGCAMLFDAELARRYPEIPKQIEFHDYWYALVASCFGGVHPIYEPLYAYRQHEENVVGITAYRGLFWTPRQFSFSELRTKAKIGWKKTQGCLQALFECNVPVPFASVLIYRWDSIGLFHFFMGAKAFFRDRAFTRACWFRWLGRLAFIV